MGVNGRPRESGDTASPDVTRAVEVFQDVLLSRGVHAALGWLNARVRHRFTGVHRIDPPVLRNLLLFDRENPTLEVGSDTPLRETYCSIVGETGRPFAMTNASCDGRVREHPARDSVLAYCGVPLVDEARGGRVFGTLCHFDLRPQRSSSSDIVLLEAISPLIVAAIL